MGFQLRDYQIECIEAIKKSDKKMNLVMSSVGSGKTVIFSKLAADATGRVLILVPQTELREQAIEKLQEIDPAVQVGSVQADLDDVDAKIVVATRQSLTSAKSTRLKRMMEHGEFEYLIVDECHQAPNQIKTVLKRINQNIKVIGFSATPYTEQSIEIFGQPIFRRSIIDMIEAEFLVEPSAIMVQSKTNISHVKTTNGDFAVGELEHAINNSERNQLVVESYIKYAKDRKATLVFAAGCEHGKELEREFNTYGIPCAYIDGNTPKEERKNTIEQFKKQKIKVLLNVLALTTGFDAPITDCLMICRPSKSRIVFEQMIGRGLRLAEDKNDCLIIDIQDIVKKHDLMNIGTVFDIGFKNGDTYKKAKKRSEDEKLEAERKRQEVELKRKQEEERKRQELEIIAQRVKLFNKDMKKGFENRKYDWWRVDNLTWGLTYGQNVHYVIEQYNEKFFIYNTVTEKDNKKIEVIIDYSSLLEAIEYVEKRTNIKNTYASKTSDWKQDEPTENQKKYCGWARSKWEVHVYFNANNVRSILNKHKKTVI